MPAPAGAEPPGLGGPGRAEPGAGQPDRAEPPSLPAPGAGQPGAGQRDAGQPGSGPAGGGIAGLVLAAGAGRRYGRPKALVERGGRLLVDHALATLREGGCAPLYVVLGAAADQVRARAALAGAVVVPNPDWAGGMGSSLRAGLAALAGTGAAAVVVLLVDTPGVTPAAVQRILGYSGPDALVVATYHGERGHPVLLGREHWAGAGELADGDVGARPYLRAQAVRVRTVACEDVAVGDDLDEPRTPGP